MADRNELGHFKPGASGNAGGKPLSAKRLRDLLELDLNLYAEVLKKQALAGEPIALKLVIERLFPAPKASRDAVVIPGLFAAETFTDKAHAVMDAISRGEVTTEDGAAVLGGIAGVLRANEMDEFNRRLAALEGGPTKPASAEGSDLL
ncbi:hypothetical protein ASG35_03055 [Burkholderia sp. Leaf177]|uniref:hypothetical protein n=1 Tax=Burkholderia sp. Leaf177 TaxID=1736287 RepID=UPI0006F9E82C|nr:hypothetical protein [Burkholderia sp. Leaf177]KQR90204.1 hypothetical protein ASG35_03055 [Burkholderia sp. Leaf177]